MYPFNTFIDETFLQMMNSVAGEKDFKPLTITHLKTHLNGEHKTLKKHARQAALDYHEEAS